MELSGLIFVALALVWAVVLIPKALKHHDDLAETRSVETVSDGMRVLARREAVSARSSRLVVTPGDPASAAALRPVTARAQRAAAATAARRRRRVLLVLLVTTAAIGAVVVAGLLPTWAPAVPAGLVVAFLAVARVTVRRERARREAHLAARQKTVASVTVETVVSAPVDATDAGSVAKAVAEAVEDAVAPEVLTAGGAGADLDVTQSIPRALLADAEPTTDSGSLWDPLPVTLPTYVGKPRATRSVRTIDLSAPDVASAGRDAAASALVAEAATAHESDGPEQRAVGS